MSLLRSVDDGAVLTIEAVNNNTDLPSELDKVHNFVTALKELDVKDTTKFRVWLTDILTLVEELHLDEQSSLIVRESIPALQSASSKLDVHHISNSLHYFLVNKGDSESICSTIWISESAWTGINNCKVPADMKLF